MISVYFQGKPFNTTVIQVYAPTINAKETEVEQFYDDLRDHLELKPRKYVLFIIEAWNAKVGHVLSELSTMTCLSWMPLHGFIELDKAVIHVISLVSFLIVVFILSAF